MLILIFVLEYFWLIKTENHEGICVKYSENWHIILFHYNVWYHNFVWLYHTWISRKPVNNPGLNIFCGNICFQIIQHNSLKFQTQNLWKSVFIFPYKKVFFHHFGTCIKMQNKYLAAKKISAALCYICRWRT